MGLARSLVLTGVAGAALFLSTAPASALGAYTCPPGTQGVIVEYNGTTTYVCTDAVYDARRIVAEMITIHLDLPPLPDGW